VIPIAYNIRNLKVRKATTLASAGGIALVVFVFASAFMLSEGMKRALDKSAQPDVAVVLRKGALSELESTVEQPKVALVANLPQVARSPSGAPLAVGELVVLIHLRRSDEPLTSNILVRGVPDDAAAFRPRLKIIEGKPPRPGTDEVMIGQGLRGRFEGAQLGGSITLMKNRPVRVVGVFSDEGSSYESELWADSNLIQSAFGREAVISSIRLRLQARGQMDALKAAVEQNRQLDMAVISEPGYYERQSEGTGAFINVIGTLVAVLFSLAAMLGATITMNTALTNRQREIGTLRALGFSRGSILLSFLLESVMLGLLGGAVGMAASVLMSFFKLSTLNLTAHTEVVFSFVVTPNILLGSLLLAILMGLLGGAPPAVRAALVSPIKAMRT
jgi:putative ABC transport system permease protein